MLNKKQRSRERSPKKDGIDAQLLAEQEPLQRRIDFRPAQMRDLPETARTPVRVLNPSSAKRMAGSGHASPGGSGGSGSGAASCSAADEAASAASKDPDSPSHLPPSRYIFSLEKLQSALKWKQFHGVGPGLSNLGNTCFMNSTLQCLTHTPAMVNLCLDRCHSRRCRTSGFCVYCELEGHMRAAHDRNNPQRAIAPRVLARNIRAVARHFRLGRQEDAHEYFLGLLDAMQTAALKAAGLGGKPSPGSGGGPRQSSPAPSVPEAVQATSEVRLVFGGRTCSQVTCDRCRNKSTSYESFLCLSVEIRNASSVAQSLKQYTAKERLDGDNRYRCAVCKGLVPASKQFLLSSAPPILALQLKRFGYGRYGGGKISKPVQFGETLDLAPYCTPECRKQHSNRYRLYGVLVHQGSSVHGGHYYCHVRAASGVWHRCDDDRVTVVSVNKVLSECAYMLFYERVDDGRPRPAAGAAAADASPRAADADDAPSAKGGSRNDSVLTYGPSPRPAAPLQPELPSDSDDDGGGSDESDGDDDEVEEGDDEYDDDDEEEEEEDEDDDDEEEEGAAAAMPPQRTTGRRASSFGRPSTLERVGRDGATMGTHERGSGAQKIPSP